MLSPRHPTLGLSVLGLAAFIMPMMFSTGCVSQADYDRWMHSLGYAEGGLVVDPIQRSGGAITLTDLRASIGYTGVGPKSDVAGTTHKGEWVVPTQGALVVRGDEPQSLVLLEKVVQLLEQLVAFGPARLNATVTANTSDIDYKAIYDTSYAHWNN